MSNLLNARFAVFHNKKSPNKKDMREVDDIVTDKATVFMDSYQSDIKADLFELTSNKIPRRRTEKEITVFFIF
jgi:ornithine cyclodeaminase/alanine dehydrogenase-like protein (mu-crystallin family)